MNDYEKLKAENDRLCKEIKEGLVEIAEMNKKTAEILREIYESLL